MNDMTPIETNTTDAQTAGAPTLQMAAPLTDADAYVAPKDPRDEAFKELLLGLGEDRAFRSAARVAEFGVAVAVAGVFYAILTALI